MSNLKCWKKVGEGDTEKMLRIAEDVYSLREATDEELAAAALCLDKWYVERKYKTQVCEPGRSRPYYDMKSEVQELCAEELIFNDGECIGARHNELIFLFDDEKTHYQEKYLGAMKVSYDQEIYFYDYYYLHSK